MTKIMLITRFQNYLERHTLTYQVKA